MVYLVSVGFILMFSVILSLLSPESSSIITARYALSGRAVCLASYKSFESFIQPIRSNTLIPDEPTDERII